MKSWQVFVCYFESNSGLSKGCDNQEIFLLLLPWVSAENLFSLKGMYCKFFLDTSVLCVVIIVESHQLYFSLLALS